MPRPYNVTVGFALTLWYQAGFRDSPKFEAMRMTRPRSVKYTSALVRALPDLAPPRVITTAGGGGGPTGEPMSRRKRKPSGETTPRPASRWAIERPGLTAGTDMDRQAP